MARDDALLVDIVSFGRRAQRHLGQTGVEELAADELLQDSLIRCLCAVGEAAARVSADLQERHPEIPWASIVGMRNRLVHGYAEIDMVEVHGTVAEDIPCLVELVRPLLPPSALDE